MPLSEKSPATLLLTNYANDLSILYRHICLSIKRWSRFSADVTRVRGPLFEQFENPVKLSETATGSILSVRAGMLALVLLLLGIVIGGIVEEDEQSSPRLFNKNEPDLFLEHASLAQFDQRGILSSQITAERFTHYPLTDVTALQSPRIKLFIEREPNPWHIHSTAGRLLPLTEYRKETVELWDEVNANRLHRDGTQTIITTAALTVFANENRAKSDEAVVITTSNSVTQASSMQAWLDSGQFQLNGSESQPVTTRLEIARPSVSD